MTGTMESQRRRQRCLERMLKTGIRRKMKGIDEMEFFLILHLRYVDFVLNQRQFLIVSSGHLFCERAGQNPRRINLE